MSSPKQDIVVLFYFLSSFEAYFYYVSCSCLLQKKQMVVCALSMSFD